MKNDCTSAAQLSGARGVGGLLIGDMPQPRVRGVAGARVEPVDQSGISS
jgi:hypothetical protein